MYKFNVQGLIIIEIPYSQTEYDYCYQIGKRQLEHNKRLGLLGDYRYQGLSRETANTVGFIGELAFEKWLASKGLVKNLHYKKANPFQETLSEIEQDFLIFDKSIGVKTRWNESLNNSLSFGTFLYPAKSHEKESLRILPYPHYVIQIIASLEKKKCWLCGYVKREDILKAPIYEIHGKPAHKILFEKYKSLDKLLEELLL